MVNNRRKTGITNSDRLFRIFATILMIIFFFIILLPFLNFLAISLSGREAVIGGKVSLVPIDPTFFAYQSVLFSPLFYSALKNSIFIAVVGTLAGMIFSISAAYPLSKRNFPLRRLVIVLFVIAMLFDVGLIPMYLMVRSLGLLNSLWSVILTLSVNVFFMLILKNYMETLPESIEESAKMDGASSLTILFRIVLPISKPVLATVALFYAVTYWNDYFNARLYINSQKLMPIQMYLRTVIFEAMDPAGAFALDAGDLTKVDTQAIINATVVVCMLPIVILYPFLQKYFVKGIIIGSVKG